MGLASEIIREAYREANLIPIGGEPTDAEVAEALPRLNNFLSSLFGFELGVKLRDFDLPKTTVSHHGHHGDHDPHFHHCPVNHRIVSSITAAATTELVQHPQDGARLGFVDLGMTATLTINANGRFIEDATAITLDPGAAPREWFYRADLGSWTLLDDLAETDPSPLPAEFDEFLSTSLAVRLMARMGNEPRTGTIDSLKRTTQRLKTRYMQDVPKGVDQDFIGDRDGHAHGHKFGEGF